MAEDLVIFAGPVIVKEAFRRIPWKRETRIVEISGASNTGLFASMAEDVRGSDGRILPGLLSRYAGVRRDQIDHLALCAWSAGWALLNRIFQVEADRRDIDAVVLSDAAFGTGLHGHEAMAADAIMGRTLMVATTTNNSANPALGIMKTGRETWLEIEREAIDLAESERHRVYAPEQVRNVEPMPPASGGVWRTGAKLWWYDYARPGASRGTGNDYTHLQHHDMAPLAWQAYLVPEFSGPSAKAVVGTVLALGGLGAAYGIYRHA